MSEENNNDYILNPNYSKPNFVNQIDDIINKYKSQLEQLKNNGINQKNQEQSIETLPIVTTATLQSKTLSSLMDAQETKKENVQNISTKFSSELKKELQNDNIKLQSALTSEKLNSVKLNSQIENYELELSKSKQEIAELQNQLINQGEEFMSQINNINNDIQKIKDENNININIIQRFFELFNKNIDLFNKSKIISCDKNTRINYLENDYEGNNQKLSVFVVNNLDILINKLLQDNKELYEQLIESKKIFDEQNNLQREMDGVREIKEENLILKEQLKNLMKENEIFQKENLKMKNNLIELNNYINNNLNVSNNNQINDVHNNYRNNYFNNYKRQRINSHINYNNNIANDKNIKENYNSSTNIKNNIANKNNISDNRDNYKYINNNNLFNDN